MLKLKNIRKSYRTKDYVQNALDEVSIEFRKNEFTSILGTSGSGKTTLLNIIGGLDQYDSGDLLIDGVSTKKYKSSDWDTYRNNRVGFVFQSFNLISHQSVLANVELALTLSGISSKERKNRAIDALSDVGLSEHINKLPNQLSGGQMQRVAIARALINDPEILLADEPTGSLDTNTSVQVMDLLKSIAKNKLVIMVTHNPELAHEYSNRIIELKDGQIIGDTNPYKSDVEERLLPKKPTRKSKMSFLTAISLSISNLMTKKGRTFITALAGSIGIIGIAAILALASGINLYIADIEEDTMSAYPLTVDSSGIDITSFLGGEANDNIPKAKKMNSKNGQVNVVNTVTALFSQQNKNDLKSFKEYIDKNERDVKPFVKNIQYKYGITPQIYLENEKAGLKQVNPDTIFSGSGFDFGGGYDIISGAGNFGMKNFDELPGDVELFKEQYDLKEGRWPKEKSELIVVLMESGSITDTTMYTLGLKDRSDLKKTFEDFSNDESVKVDKKKDDIKYNDILKTKFKLVNSAEKYIYDETYDIWVDKSEDAKFMDKLIEEGMDLNVVGIIKAKDDVKTPMLSSGIYYPNELSPYLIKEASSYDIVKDQLANEDINIFTNKSFEDESEFNPEEIFQLEDFITIDQSMIRSSFSFDASALNMDILDLDLNLDQIDFPDLDLETLVENIGNQINAPTEDIQEILVNILEDFVIIQGEQGITELDEWVGNFDEYIRSEEVQNRITSDFEEINENNQISENLTEIVQNYFNSYINVAFNQVIESVQNDITSQIESRMPQIASNIQDGIRIDTNKLAQAFQFNLEEDELFDLISSLGERGQTSQKSNLKELGYRDIDEPTPIDLYPKDFTTKDSVVEFIDNYNTQMQNTNQGEKVVKYTDLIAAILSSVTTIIDTITYALIAFVAISLVVSSIMIGVITYVSVLERIKEIGILRAIGASKKD
ncbi:MAG: ABC transporter ATP-binding protein/permease, partial [Senegalia sp. (in: firmicutes)]